MLSDLNAWCVGLNKGKFLCFESSFALHRKLDILDAFWDGNKDFFKSLKGFSGQRIYGLKFKKHLTVCY